MILAVLLLAFILVTGPTVHLFQTLDGLDRRMDAVLLGLVDGLVALRRHVHRAHLARAYRA
jgi:hypothetical protein